MADLEQPFSTPPAVLSAFARTNAAIIYAATYGFGVPATAAENVIALAAAYAAVPATGGTIFIPSGRNRLDTTFWIDRPNIRVEGCGGGLRSKAFEPGAQTGEGSKLVFTSAVDGIRIGHADGAAATVRLGGISIARIGIVGTGIANGKIGVRAEKGTGNPDVYGPTDRLILDQVDIIDYQTCVTLINTDYTCVHACWLGESGNGLFIQNGYYTNVYGNCICDNVGYGLKVDSILGGGASMNEIVRNGGESVWLTGTARSFRIVANSIRNDAGNPAITIFANLLRLDSGVIRNTISANTFDAITGTGFLINAGALENTFSGNSHDNFSPSYGNVRNYVDGWQSGYTAPAFSNGWVNNAGGYEGASYRRSRAGGTQGFCHFQGTVKDGTVGVGVTAMTLPTGFRPPSKQVFFGISNNGAIDSLARIAVNTDGTVCIEAGSNVFIAFNFTFPIATFTA